jgi:hypothetical protein
MQGTGIFESRTPASFLAPSLIADPAEEALEEFGRDFEIALNGILSNEDAVPEKLKGQLWYRRGLDLILPMPMFLYPVELFLCLRPVPFLPEPGHVEIGRLVEVILCRPFLDFIEKPGLIIGVVVITVV